MASDGTLHHDTGACLELAEDHHKIFMNDCDPNNLRQHWIWKLYEKPAKAN